MTSIGQSEEIRATENMRSFWSSFAAVPGGWVEKRSGAELAWSGINNPMMNSVTLWSADEKLWKMMFARAEGLIAEFGIPMNWRIAPSAATAGATHFLDCHGVGFIAEIPAMFCRISDFSVSELPAGFQIEEVETSTIKILSEISAATFGMNDDVMAEFETALTVLSEASSDWKVDYIGYLDGQAVAVATLITAADYAGIYFVGTLPEARNRGIGAAMTAHAMEEGRRRGLQEAHLQATEMGFPVYERLGFKTAFSYKIYRQS